MVRVAGHAGHDVGVARLHGPRGPAKRRNCARASKRDRIEPPHAQTEMLRQADCAIGSGREAGNAEPVDIAWRDPGILHQRLQRAPNPPLRAFDRIAHVGYRDGGRHDDAVVRCS